MIRFGITVWVCLASMFALEASATAQNRCADCHFANPAAPAGHHLSDWDLSAHRRNDVGCEKCHGGDASTFEPFLAHRGILNSMNPASPVNRRNLPTTCGACHAGPFVAFQKSRHFELLKKGDNRIPVCSTCHGDAAAWRPSARALDTECHQCHGQNGVAPRPARAEAARAMYEALHDARGLMKSVRSLMNRVGDKPRRVRLEDAYEQAEVPLAQATNAGHQFQYDEMDERLAVAQRRIQALLEQLVNPKP